MKEHDYKVWKGLVIGLAAGAAGSWVMNQFQAAWSKAAASLTKKRDSQSQEQGHGNGESVPATVKAASAVSRGLFHHELTDREKQLAGPVVHYAFGAAMGGLYGALAETRLGAAKMAGIPFGTALWAAADEAAVPALRLGPPATKTPASQHAYALASHWVYALSMELVRLGLRRVWRRH